MGRDDLFGIGAFLSCVPRAYATAFCRWNFEENTFSKTEIQYSEKTAKS